MFLGLPAPLFTIDMEGSGGVRKIDCPTFKRLFDNLEPAFGLQVSLGQVSTLVLCPALTSHSELSDEALRAAGIAPTTLAYRRRRRGPAHPVGPLHAGGRGDY